MNKIQVLDCTLRDGGYCNKCRFGFENEKKIVHGLVEANVDIIECGFLMNTVEYDEDVTRFTSLDEVAKIIPKDKEGKTFVMLTDYGKYRPEDLPEYDGASVDGLRVAFHKKDRVVALEECKEIKNKGYKVFVQAMVSLSYADEEFLDLIRRVNELEPYAFYIVDSFGMMKRKDLTRLFYLVEHNLNEKIKIGFHSHNNMQLAYSNAQSLVDLHSDRELIIDSSVYGMGRGAGNLNTELFVQYLNDNADGNYDIKPLLSIIDEILNEFYQRNYWGYSLPNYLSAAHNAHPNYAGYLDDKKTLTVENMNEIFDMMDEDKKVSYDKDYIEQLYLRYMATGKSQEEHKAEMQEKIKGKTILLIAPGKSSIEEKQKIATFIDEDVVTISVNYNYPLVNTDYIFLSNLRRFRELETSSRKKCIVTSNIPADNVYIQTKYRDLLCDIEAVKDNAGLMAIKYFAQMGAKKIYLAGFDGYSHDEKENYGEFSAIALADPSDFDWDSLFDGVTWFHWTGINPALSDNMIQICEQGCRKAKEKGITISCDLNYRKNLWSPEKAQKIMSSLIQYVDVCIANEEDADKVLGIKAPNNNVELGQLNKSGYEYVAKEICNRFGCKKVAITLRESINASHNGWSGMLYDRSGTVNYSAHYDVDIVDRVGGGDSFTGAIIYSLITGKSDKSAIEFAVAASCLKQSIEGDYNRVTVNDVENLVNNGGNGRVER